MQKRWIGFLALICVLQWLSGYYKLFGETSPQWCLIFITALAIHHGSLAGELFGFFLGLFVDVLSVQLFGGHCLIFTWVGYGVGRFKRQIDVSRTLSQMVLLFVISLIYGMLFALIYLISFHSFPLAMARTFVIQAFYNTLLAPLVFYWIEKFGLNSESSGLHYP